MSSLKGSALPKTVLSPKQRLALVHGTNVSTSTILNMEDAQIDLAFLLENKISPHNLAAADVSPLVLKARGASDSSDLVSLGYDALHLCDPVFCDGAIAAFGAASVVDTFISTALDAVSVAGSGAMERLGLTTQTLLEACTGASIEAFAVLKSNANAEGIRASTLLDTGLRGRQLAELGWTQDRMVGTRAEIAKLFA